MKDLTLYLITLYLWCRILLPDTLQGKGEDTLLSLDDCNESHSLYILWKAIHFSFLTCFVGSACSSQCCSRRALVYLESHLLSTSLCRGLWCLQVFQFTLSTAEPSLQVQSQWHMGSCRDLAYHLTYPSWTYWLGPHGLNDFFIFISFLLFVLEALNFKISNVNHPARMGTKSRLRSSGGCKVSLWMKKTLRKYCPLDGTLVIGRLRQGWQEREIRGYFSGVFLLFEVELLNQPFPSSSRRAELISLESLLSSRAQLQCNIGIYTDNGKFVLIMEKIMPKKKNPKNQKHESVQLVIAFLQTSFRVTACSLLCFSRALTLKKTALSEMWSEYGGAGTMVLKGDDAELLWAKIGRGGKVVPGG